MICNRVDQSTSVSIRRIITLHSISEDVGPNKFQADCTDSMLDLVDNDMNESPVLDSRETQVYRCEDGSSFIKDGETGNGLQMYRSGKSKSTALNRTWVLIGVRLKRATSRDR